jgi:hypothetical protein
MLLVLAYYATTRAGRVTHGFVAYYTFARMLVDGKDLEKAYDAEYFNATIQEYGVEGINDIAHNLPTMALLLAPVASLPPEHAKIVLSAVSFCALLVSLLILLSLYGVHLKQNLGKILTLLFLCWRPIYDNLYLGQIYALLLMLFCIAIWGLKRRQHWTLPVTLAAAFLFKGHGLVPMVWLALQRHWKAFLLTLVFIVATVAITMPLIGTATWSVYYSGVVSNLGTNPTDAGTTYQTINSLIFHLFTYDPQWLPNPLFVLPSGIVRLISYALNLAIIGYILIRTKLLPTSASVISFSAALAAGVITAPLAEEYAFTLFLPLALGLAATIGAKLRQTRRLATIDWICLSAILLLAAPLPYKNLHFTSFPLVLFAYPKLFAGGTVLLCFTRMAKIGYFDQEPGRA